MYIPFKFSSLFVQVLFNTAIETTQFGQYSPKSKYTRYIHSSILYRAIHYYCELPACPHPIIVSCPDSNLKTSGHETNPITYVSHTDHSIVMCNIYMIV